MLIPLKSQGYSASGQRLYRKGGGDPGAEARRQEDDRQGRIRAATDEINAIFNNQVKKAGVWEAGDPANSRDKLYEKQRTAVYDLNKLDVDRQASEAERRNRFGLARSGLLGGSANVDSMSDIDRRTNEGLMRSGGIAGQAAADLKTADERTRSNLISMAQSGIDVGTAAQQSLKGLEVNSANAAGARAGATVGNLFGDMSQAYLYNQMMQGRESGRQGGGQWSGVSSPGKTYSGT